MSPQRSSPWVLESRFRGNQLIRPTLPIHRPGNHSSRAMRTVAQRRACAPSYLKMRPSTSATLCGNTQFSSISKQTALVVVLSWNNQGPTIRSDVTPHHMLTLGLRERAPLGHVGSYCPRSCNCGGVQVAVRCCYLTKTWTDLR
jgi:hypothetical protein